MKKIKAALIILVVGLAITVIGGQLGAGAFLLWKLKLPMSDLGLTTFYQFLSHFGFSSSIKLPLVIATAIAVIPPVFIVFVVIAALIPNSPLKELHGNARFTTRAELKRDKLLFDDDAYFVKPDGSIQAKKGYKYPPVILGKVGKDLVADYSQLYTSVIAAPGTGKGVGFVIPNLLVYPESCVVLDPKNENWNITAGFRSAPLSKGGLGQKCYLFSPDADSFDSYRSHRWNPLDYVIDTPIDRLDSIKDITTILVPDVEGQNASFHTQARSLVNGIIMYLFENPDERSNRNLARVLHILRAKGGLERYLGNVLARCTTVDAVLGQLLSTLPDAVWKDAGQHESALEEIQIAFDEWQGTEDYVVVVDCLRKAAMFEKEGAKNGEFPIARARKVVSLLAEEGPLELSDQCIGLLSSWANSQNERGRDAVRGIADQDLEAFDSPVLAKATEASDFWFGDLRKERISIYVGVSPSGLEKLPRLLNVFFSQCIKANIRRLPEQDPALKYQCLMLLDEFVALKKVSVIQTSSGLTRGYNMRYALVFQNKQQAESIYGREGAGALLNTIHNEVVLSAESQADAEDYSKRIGNTTLYQREVQRSSGGGKGSSSSISHKPYERPLRLPQEITHMDDDIELIFKKDIKNPIECGKIFWFKDKYFTARANWSVPQVPALDMANKESQDVA